MYKQKGVRAVDRKPDMDIGDKARTIKDLFEKGKVYNDDNDDNVDGKNGVNHKSLQDDDDRAVFEQGK